MEITNETLRNKYASLDDETLLALDSDNGLSETAKILIKEEIQNRKLSGQAENGTYSKDTENDFVADFVQSAKNSIPLSEKMTPAVYLSIFLIPILFAFSVQRGFFTVDLPNHILLVIGYLPIVGVFLFARKANCILESEFEIQKPGFQILLLIPFINMVYQYWSVKPLGKRIRRAIDMSDYSDPGFKGILSTLYCHIFIALNIVVQIEIHLQINNNSPSFIFVLMEWIMRGAWVYVTGLMLWEYSKIINSIRK